MEKVIILMDFSKEAKNTVDYGIQFALEYDKEVEFLNTTLYSDYYLSYTGESKQELEYRHFEKAKESFTVLIHDLTQRYQELPEIDIEIQYGMRLEVVRKILEQKHAQLIITSGRLKKNHLQFVTDENKLLIENCNCPILIIPPDTAFKSYTKLIYATDYNEDDIYLSRQLISKTTDSLQMTYGIHTINSKSGFHKNNERKFNEIIKQNIKYDQLQIDLADNVEIAETILDYAELKEADIVAITTENQEIMGSFSEPHKIKLLPETKLPLLIFQNNLVISRL